MGYTVAPNMDFIQKPVQGKKSVENIAEYKSRLTFKQITQM